jgi:hypothetical protein
MHPGGGSRPFWRLCHRPQVTRTCDPGGRRPSASSWWITPYRADWSGSEPVSSVSLPRREAASGGNACMIVGPIGPRTLIS